jgi:hypothetical protein
MQVKVSAAGEHRGFQRRAPRLWQFFHPAIQIVARGGNPSVCMDLAAAVFYAITDLLLVNI